ncbi:MAG: DUF4167 domain-containing protein [Pseudomonadota bacterium]
MRHGNNNQNGSSNRRSRGRGNGRRGGGNQQRMQVFDSNGPDVRIRGTAHQVTEKYVALAKDASSSGDHILAQSYLQYAEHYQRIINSWEAENVQKDGKPNNSRGGNKQKSDKSKDDLALPSSILGESANVDSKERTAEGASA